MKMETQLKDPVNQNTLRKMFSHEQVSDHELDMLYAEVLSGQDAVIAEGLNASDEDLVRGMVTS